MSPSHPAGEALEIIEARKPPNRFKVQSTRRVGGGGWEWINLGGYGR